MYIEMPEIQLYTFNAHILVRIIHVYIHMHVLIWLTLFRLIATAANCRVSVTKITFVLVTLDNNSRVRKI